MAEMQEHLDDAKQHELDRALDAALAKYSTVEPRLGLEARILASLRAEREQIPQRSWWRVHYIASGMAAALAAIVVVALALAWRTGKPSPPVVANLPSTATQPSNRPANPVVSNSNGRHLHAQEREPTRNAAIRRSPPKVVANNPKLDHFPSPRPLSEQEKMALDYVREFPEQATLIARAQTNLAQQEERENIRPQPAGAAPSIENHE
jgi:hypothetical protein